MDIFQAIIERRPPCIVIKASGELDLAAEAEFRKQVDLAVESAPQRLLFDLSELRFMDSTGLRVILEAYRCLGMRQRVAVCGLTPRLERLFRISGIIGRVGGMTAYPTLEDALAQGRSRTAPGVGGRHSRLH
ncbi:hypothetical protein GCM10009530_32560 [Microbispora corallina]|uniref:Anti-sigma factor antagonist n=1 Tax=Microbispora corallina TaxID=83302 RepID=A0ABQ4GC28_9ACTN|nr:STAS domain-containing protein [Microbispora corallina]GIH44538.1 hypothetical protein Mco01_75380 [Microbispora corallina]